MFRGSRVVRQQLLAADGVLGFAMLAEPLRKNYATLSVWRDEEALDAFAGTHPHARLMAELAPSVGGHEILPIGGHESARWWPTVLPTGGQWFCPR
jgi:hypothetical protein